MNDFYLGIGRLPDKNADIWVDYPAIELKQYVKKLRSTIKKQTSNRELSHIERLIESGINELKRRSTGWYQPYDTRSVHFFVNGTSLCWDITRGYLTTNYALRKSSSKRLCTKCIAKLRTLHKKRKYLDFDIEDDIDK